MPYSSDHAAASGRSPNPDELHHAARTGSYSHCEPTPESLDHQDSRQSRPELNYLSILKDAVDSPSNRQCGNTSAASTSPGQEETFTSQIRHLYKPPQLNDFDKEFLAKKGVFDLPPQRYMCVMVQPLHSQHLLTNSDIQRRPSQDLLRLCLSLCPCDRSSRVSSRLPNRKLLALSPIRHADSRHSSRTTRCHFRVWI